MTKNAGSVAQVSLRGPHQPRHLRFLELHETAGWRLKVYGVSVDRPAPDPNVIEAVKALAPSALPGPAVHTGSEEDPYDTDRYGVGFVIAHDTGERVYALYDWWADENEIHQRMLSGRRAWLDLRPHPTAAIGCVWEMAVTDFERRAWLRHVLQNPDGPDVAAYLEDRMEAEDV